MAALGRSTNERGETDDRVIPVKDLEVAVLDRTRTQPRKFSRLASQPARERCSATAGRPPSNPVEEGAEHPPGTAATDADPDDPKDPTDQVSGDAPPLPTRPERPPPVAPPPRSGTGSTSRSSRAEPAEAHDP